MLLCQNSHFGGSWNRFFRWISFTITILSLCLIQVGQSENEWFKKNSSQEHLRTSRNVRSDFSNRQYKRGGNRTWGGSDMLSWDMLKQQRQRVKESLLVCISLSHQISLSLHFKYDLALPKTIHKTSLWFYAYTSQLFVDVFLFFQIKRGVVWEPLRNDLFLFLTSKSERVSLLIRVLEVGGPHLLWTIDRLAC